MDEKEGTKAGKGHTVSYIGEMMPLSGSRLSRAKQDMMIVVSFHESTVAALGCVHFMPFVSLDRNCCTLRISIPKVDCDSCCVLYFSQTRYGLSTAPGSIHVDFHVTDCQTSMSLL
jgi:hypothetical protein